MSYGWGGSFSPIAVNLVVNVIHTSFTVLKYSHMLTELPSGCIHSLPWKLRHVLLGPKAGQPEVML